MFQVPSKYLDDNLDFMVKNKETEQLLIKELIKTSPEFDQYLFDHRDKILSKKHDEFQAKMDYGKAILEEKSTKMPHLWQHKYIQDRNYW